MYIHDIIPFQKGIPIDVLSYYHPTTLTPGTVVTIKIGNAPRLGLVFANRSLLEEKTAVRNASFTLKKIDSVLFYHETLEHLVTTLLEMGKKTLAPLGAIIAATISEKYFEQLLKITQKKEIAVEEKERRRAGKKEIDMVIGETNARAAIYKEHIREYLALGRSVVVVVPTILDAEKIATTLSKGIEKKTICIHSKKKLREFSDAVQKITTNKEPVVIIATPAFSFALRNDVGLFIIEKESSDLYESNDRFHIDTRLMITSYAEKIKSDVIVGDILPRFEHFAKKEHTRYPPLPTLPKIEVVAPTMEKKSLLPKEVVELLHFAKEKNRTLFFYSHRRGLAPISRCKDCGAVVACPTCNLPLVLKKDKTNEQGVPLFICNSCDYTTSSHYTCRTCRSWNIVALEIGTDSIIAEIKKVLGSTQRVVSLDSDFRALTPEERIKLMIPGTIYVGTEHFFPYVPEVDYTIMPFFDRLLSTPSYETMEKALRVLLLAHEWSIKKAIIFSQGTHSLFQQIQKGTLERFIADELQLRKQFQFPPYGVFIRISVSAPAGSIEKVTTLCTSVFAEENISPLSLGLRRTSQSSNSLQKSWILLTSDAWLLEYGPGLVQKLTQTRATLSIERNPHYFN